MQQGEGETGKGRARTEAKGSSLDGREGPSGPHCATSWTQEGFGCVSVAL